MARGTRAVRFLAMNFVLGLAVCAGTANPVYAQAVDDRLTFQGELKDGAGFATGSYDFRFRLYDALVGGSQIGPQVTTTAALVDGKFTVSLQFPGAFNSGQQRYIEVETGPAGSGIWNTLSPRQLLTASPNATWAINSGTATAANTFGGQVPTFYTNASNMSAGSLPGGRLSGSYTNVLTFSNVGNNYFGNGSNLTGLNAANIGSGTISDARLSSNVALLNNTQTFTGSKTFANGTSPLIVTDTAAGGWALEVQNAGGTSVHVLNNAGVLAGYGFAADVDGLGTKYGATVNVSGSSGVAYGYQASVDGISTRYGARLDMLGAAGTGYGVYVTNPTPSGRGYYASMTGTGTTYGIQISSNSPTGYAGHFNNTSTTGVSYGLYCENNSADGYGIFALHDATTGTGPAVYGRTDSTAAFANAVHGVVNSTTAGGSSAGVRGENRSTSGSGIGVWGSQAGTGWGVYGSASTGGRGVYGDAGGEGYGVYGNTDDGYGVFGNASPTNTTEVCYGVRGQGGNSDNSYGGYFSVSGAGIGVYGYSTGSYGGYFDTGVAGGPALYVVGTASVGVMTIRGGADLAENFEVVSDAEEVKAGMVVMIDADHEGGVKLASGAYNKCVAGVVSGANELNAGMVLGVFDGQKDAKPVALSGRVYTYVDATNEAVEPGDLLTTSDTPGYAMVASDSARANGATIGKAMGRLAKGEKGMVLVLVNLQ